MKNIFSGTFEQVEEAVSENLATYILETMRGFTIGRSVFFILVFIGLGSYGVYGVAWYIVHYPEEIIISLDKNNEFTAFLSSIWYIHGMALLLFIVIMTTLVYRRKHIIKSYFIWNSGLTVFSLFFLIYVFKVFQLIVPVFAVRMTFVALFIGCAIYVGIWSYRQTVEMVYGTRKKSELVEWVLAHRRSVISVLVSIGSLYYLSKVIFDPEKDFQRRIFGPLVEYIPLFECLLLFTHPFAFRHTIKSFYLYKYSKEFRQKFGIEEKDWYGDRYKAS